MSVLRQIILIYIPLKSFSSLDIGLYLAEKWHKETPSNLVVNPFLDHLLLGLAKHKLFLHQPGIYLGRREEDPQKISLVVNTPDTQSLLYSK